jgi:CspA family cold shock protein
VQQLRSNLAPGSRASKPHNEADRNKKEGNTNMPTGTVKFFNNEKGYGFISRPDGDDVFVHYSNIEGDGYRSLEEGQEVEFEVGTGRKGDEAKAVRAI